MTTLVGIDSSTNFTEGRTNGTPNRVVSRVYTAVASGTISEIRAYMQYNWTGYKLGVWRASDGVLIASTAEIGANVGDTWVAGAASGSIVAGTDYVLGIMRNGNASGYPNDCYWYSYTTGSVWIGTDDTGTYPTVTSPISPGANGILQGQLPIYVDGTVSGGDTTAPVLSAPTGTSTGTSTATVGATTDEGNGTLYAVVTTSATQPSVAQIKAGQNHTGAAAAWSGSLAISSTGAKTLNATGLSQGTTYYAHLVHNDAANNDSNRVASASFTTSAVTITDAGDETFQPGESITITGTTFGASQGSGKVYLSPTDSIADGSKVEQTVTSWGASSITITVAKGALLYGAAYLFVQENGGVSNAAGYAVSFITRGAQRSMLLGIG